MTKIITIDSKVHSRHEVLVDDEDYELVVQGNWHLSMIDRPRAAKLYARGRPKGEYEQVLMHRFILGLKPEDVGLQVHHKNENGLDNRKANMELLTPSKHVLLTNGDKIPKYAYKHRRRYRAQVGVMGAKIYLGYFDTEEEAQAAVQEYLRCNQR